MAGLLQPSSGTVDLDGKALFANPESLKQLGYCPSPDHFYEDVTGLEFVAYMGRLSGLSPAAGQGAGRGRPATRWPWARRRASASAA